MKTGVAFTFSTLVGTTLLGMVQGAAADGIFPTFNHDARSIRLVSLADRAPTNDVSNALPSESEGQRVSFTEFQTGFQTFVAPVCSLALTFACVAGISFGAGIGLGGGVLRRRSLPSWQSASGEIFSFSCSNQPGWIAGRWQYTF